MIISPNPLYLIPKTTQNTHVPSPQPTEQHKYLTRTQRFIYDNVLVELWLLFFRSVFFFVRFAPFLSHTLRSVLFFFVFVFCTYNATEYGEEAETNKKCDLIFGHDYIICVFGL